MGTPRPTEDRGAVKRASEARSRALRDLRWWQGRIIADTPLSAAEYARYTRMVAGLHAAGEAVEYYKRTVGEEVPPRLRESLGEHYRRALYGRS